MSLPKVINFLTIISFVKGLLNDSPKTFFEIFAFSLLSSIGTGILAHWIAINFNRQIYSRLRHYSLCVFASIFVFFSIVLFYASTHAEHFASGIIEGWQTRVTLNDQAQWKKSAFVQAYEAVKALGKENFIGFPHPDQGGIGIPVTKKESKEIVSKIYAEKTAKNFFSQHPFLTKSLWVKLDIFHYKILNDVVRRADNIRSFDSNKAIEIASSEVSKKLKTKLSHVPITLKIISVLIGIVSAFLVFILAYIANSDIKEPEIVQLTTEKKEATRR